MTEALSPPLRASLLEVVRGRGYLHREEPFRLASGELSHDYVDMRKAVSAGADLEVVATAVIEALAGIGDFGAIGGMTMGADPVAHAVALLSGKNWFSVRKQEKDHGSGRRIEGTELDSGSTVVVFEDTVSTGGSLLDALDVVVATGAAVLACLTVLDRGDLAAAEFARRKVPYVALLGYKDLGIEPIRGVAAPGVASGS